MPGPVQKIMIVDDHDVVRRGVRAVIESRQDLAVVAEAACADEALELARQACPDIAIVDLTLPGRSGIELTAALKRQHPGLEVLVLTLHEREEMVGAAIEAGASAYLLKSGEEGELLAAIAALAVGRIYFSDLMTRELVAKIRSAKRSTTEFHRLTPREKAVVELISRGRTGKEIARALGITPKTVETHRAAVRKKLKAESTADLVRYAVRNGLINV